MVPWKQPSLREGQGGKNGKGPSLFLGSRQNVSLLLYYAFRRSFEDMSHDYNCLNAVGGVPILRLYPVRTAMMTLIRYRLLMLIARAFWDSLLRRNTHTTRARRAVILLEECQRADWARRKTLCKMATGKSDKKWWVFYLQIFCRLQDSHQTYSNSKNSKESSDANYTVTRQDLNKRWVGTRLVPVCLQIFRPTNRNLIPL